MSEHKTPEQVAAALPDDRPELSQKLSELEILKQSLDEAKAREKELYDQLLRLTAEYQTFRRRNEERGPELRRAGREDVLLKAISLADGLLQAEAASRDAKDVEALKKGITLVREQFERFLADHGVKAIEARGRMLDPHLHEALSQLPADAEEGTILDEIQRGYVIDGRVIRPARVVVAAPKQNPS